MAVIAKLMLNATKEALSNIRAQPCFFASSSSTQTWRQAILWRTKGLAA